MAGLAGIVTLLFLIVVAYYFILCMNSEQISPTTNAIDSKAGKPSTESEMKAKSIDTGTVVLTSPLQIHLYAIPDAQEDIKTLTRQARGIQVSGSPRVLSIDGSTRALSDDEIAQGELLNLDQEFPSGYVVYYEYDLKIDGQKSRIFSTPQLSHLLWFAGPSVSQVVENGTKFPALHTMEEDKWSISDFKKEMVLDKRGIIIQCSGVPWLVSYRKDTDGYPSIEAGTRSLTEAEIVQGSPYLDREFPSGYVVCYPYHIQIDGKTTYIISTPQLGHMLFFTGPGAFQVEEDDEDVIFHLSLDELSEPGSFSRTVKEARNGSQP